MCRLGWEFRLSSEWFPDLLIYAAFVVNNHQEPLTLFGDCLRNLCLVNLNLETQLREVGGLRRKYSARPPICDYLRSWPLKYLRCLGFLSYESVDVVGGGANI